MYNWFNIFSESLMKENGFNYGFAPSKYLASITEAQASTKM